MARCILFKPQDGYPLTTVSVQILPENLDRQFLSFQNLSTVNVSIQFSRDAAMDETLRLGPGGFVAYDVIVPGNAVFARAETGTAKLVVTEA